MKNCDDFHIRGMLSPVLQEGWAGSGALNFTSSGQKNFSWRCRFSEAFRKRSVKSLYLDEVASIELRSKPL
ncbi:MAG: hypothetical protein N3B10_07235 [Armatimonadetes bacterium]|nr:hypothetical protein [Armatimonadota bacterium]